ncbi:MAG: helix-turn-helix transcriptional regulator [Clostridia bacterium]|nr:helix-turn-helix transcriptional regulator [Clostridia bacterium]
MEYTEAVGKRLKELLSERHFTQTKFAKGSNISRMTINRTINGKVRIVTFETLIVFCKTLNITLRDFFSSELFGEDIEFYKKKKGRRIN